MTKTTSILLAGAAGLALCLGSSPARALTISATQVNATTDNDDGSNNEDAGSGGAWLTDTSYTISDVVSNSATISRRYFGHAEAAETNGFIVQDVDVTVTYSVTSSNAPTVYSISFLPEFHARVAVDSSGAPDTDGVTISNLTGKVNGVTYGLLGMSGGSQTTNGTTNIDETGARTFSGLTGNNTFAVNYRFTITADGDVGILDNTFVAGLWGMDGTLNAGGVTALNDALDEYGTSAARDADGLFMPATVTITAIPEPGTLLLIGAGLVGLAAQGRRRA